MNNNQDQDKKLIEEHAEHVLRCFEQMGMKAAQAPTEYARLLTDQAYLESWLKTVSYRKENS